MTDLSERCQFDYTLQIEATVPSTYSTWPWEKFLLSLRLFRLFYPRVDAHTALTGVKFNGQWNPVVLFLERILRRDEKPAEATGGSGMLNLQPGEWVEVRSLEELFATLDEKGKLRGMGFMPEMVQFCGKRFRVHKRVSKIVLESTGEQRTIMTPTVFLEGVYCDGKFHGGCDRECYCFWREAWLKRIPPE